MTEAARRASSRPTGAQGFERHDRAFQRSARRRFDMVAALFWTCAVVVVVTAAMGVWAAYDRGPALQKFVWMVIGIGVALALPVAARFKAGRVVRLVTALCPAVVVVIALVGLGGGPEGSDAAGGAVAILLPLATVALHDPWPRLRTAGREMVPTALAVALGLVALAAAHEGAAWAALAGGAVFAVWARTALTSPTRPLAAWISGALLGVAGVTAALASLTSLRPLGSGAERLLPPHVAGRLSFWHDALALVQDYVYTGSGLASTGMVLSSYVWQLHVAFTEHVHHLFLQVAIEQGVAGCVAFVGMIVTSGWAIARRLVGHDAARHPRSVAAGASLAALVLYGLAESDLYCSPLLPFLFLPFGFVWMLDVADRRDVRTWQLSSRWVIVTCAGGGIVALAALTRVVGSAQWQANLGAVAQTRAELSVYQWPKWGIQDVLRRDNVVDLGPAVTRYRAALSRDPGNVTALRRLGQIELSRGDYESATQHLTRAYARAPDQRATRQMLGEVRAVSGDIGGAVGLWSSTGNEHRQLDARAWWYGHLGATDLRGRLQRAIDLVRRVTP